MARSKCGACAGTGVVFDSEGMEYNCDHCAATGQIATKNRAAVALGRKGGQVTSAKKAAACRVNMAKARASRWEKKASE